jgi:hypothetical protein
MPFQFKGLPWQNSELSEMLVQLFYEFASENARTPSHLYHPINRKHD